MRRHPLAALLVAALAASCASSKGSMDLGEGAGDPDPSPDARIDGADAPDDAIGIRDVADPGIGEDLPASPDLAPEADAPGSELPPPPPGCCRDGRDCQALLTCEPSDGLAGTSGYGVCAAHPEAGRCWTDGECGLGQGCVGASLCPCGMDCLLATSGPGVCAPVGGACATLAPAWVTETCDAASVVVFDGTTCVSTCPGCCGCEPFCGLTFPSIAACQAVCATPPAACSPWVGALADGPFTYLWDDAPPGACPRIAPRPEPCRTDADCPSFGPGARAGALCLFGSCVECRDTSQCGAEGTVCLMGRCVDPADATCPPAVHSDVGPGCSYVTLGESPCAVYTCDRAFGHSCGDWHDCTPLDDHPYEGCGLTRCALCVSDVECTRPGEACMAPGRCLPAEPHASWLQGAWLLEVAGPPTRAAYLRFEFDGGLRRAHFEPSAVFLADLPPLPCEDSPTTWPQRGAWEPVPSAGGQLRIHVSLNLYCDPRDGFQGDWDVTFTDASHATATFLDGVSGLEYIGRKVAPTLCQPDFSACPTPGA